jgi:D-alanyl-D-alanine dipeptidase
MKFARVTLAALFLGAMACSSVQTVRNPAQFFATARPQMVVVIYNDNSEVPVAQPQMRGDTVVGEWQGLSESVAIPLDQVQRIDAVQKDSKKTALFITALVAAAAVTTYGFARAHNDTGVICDFFRPDDRQCYTNSATPGEDLRTAW